MRNFNFNTFTSEINLTLTEADTIEVWIALIERRQRAEADLEAGGSTDEEEIEDLRTLIAKVQAHIIDLPGFKVNNSLLEEE